MTDQVELLVDIPGATSSTYTMTSADVGQNITCTVIGTNSAGSANGTSNSLGPVTAGTPVNTVAPVIAGTPQESQMLTVTNNGTWTGFPAPAFTYQWNRNPPVSAEASQWLARATGLDAAHIAADTALIDGLVADGDWGSFDVIHVYATQNSTTANLNLVSSSYPATPVGGPTFTVDRGYTGSTVGPKYIGTGFTPSSAPSPKFVQNSAHLSMWEINETTTSTSAAMGVSSGSSVNQVTPRLNDNNAYFHINTLTAMSVGSVSSVGLFMANRSSSVALQGYKNGVSVVTSVANNSVAVNNTEIFVAGEMKSGTPNGANVQVAIATIGSSLSAAAALRVYNRFRTRLTAVGVP